MPSTRELTTEAVKKKSVTIEELMGYALGSVGLTLDDFCRLTPKEFGAVCQSWRDTEEQRMEDAWERMRLLAVITTQPHVKKKLEPKKLLPFPWEKPKKPKAEVVSREEARKRFERLMGNKRD